MRNLGADVGDELASIERIEVLGERLPFPFDAIGQGRSRDVLDPLHQADQPLASFGFGRGETDTAVPHHDRGHAVPAGWSEIGIPRGLGVVVRVHVDPPGGDDQPVGIDLACPVGGDGARWPDGHDVIAVDGQLSEVGLAAGAIDDRAVANHDVVRGVLHRTIVADP